MIFELKRMIHKNIKRKLILVVTSQLINLCELCANFLCGLCGKNRTAKSAEIAENTQSCTIPKFPRLLGIEESKQVLAIS